MGTVEFEVDLPLVRLNLGGEPTTEQYHGLFDQFEAAVPPGTEYVVIVDVLKMTAAANAAQRQVMATRMAKLTATGRVELASLIVLDSPIIRGALTALSWLSRRTHIPVATIAEAEERAHRVLEQRGFPIPRSLRKVGS